MNSNKSINKLRSIKTDGFPVTTLYLDVSNSQKLKNSKIVVHNLYKYKKEKTFYKNMDNARIELVEQDIDIITKYLNDKISVEEKSLMIISSSNSNIFEIIKFNSKVDNNLVIQDAVYLRPLLEAKSAQRKYGIVLIDQGKAKIFERNFNSVNELFSVENILSNDRNNSGFEGRDERKNERKHEENLHRHYKNVSQSLLEIDKKKKFNWIVLGGKNQIFNDFQKYIDDSQKEKIKTDIVIEPSAKINEVMEIIQKTEPKMRNLFEKNLLDKLNDEFYNDQKGVLGIKQVEEALEEGKVDTLIIKEDFHQKGRICKKCGYSTEDEVNICPRCDNKMERTVDISDDLVHSALKINADIEYVAIDMGKYDPIAAILRYN